jgi:putative membrane protein
MQFLKTLFWILLGVIAAFFAFRNWTPVSIALWDGLVMETRLPILLLVSFLLGLLPTLLLHRATRWSLKRRIDTMERALVDTRPPVPSSPSATLPPSAAPIAVPPGVS